MEVFNSEIRAKIYLFWYFNKAAPSWQLSSASKHVLRNLLELSLNKNMLKVPYIDIECELRVPCTDIEIVHCLWVWIEIYWMCQALGLSWTVWLEAQISFWRPHMLSLRLLGVVWVAFLTMVAFYMMGCTLHGVPLDFGTQAFHFCFMQFV